MLTTKKSFQQSVTTTQSWKKVSIYNTLRRKKRMNFLKMRCRTTMTVYYHRKASTLNSTRMMRTFMMMLDTLSLKRASTTRLICIIVKMNGKQSSTAMSTTRKR